MRTLDPNDQRLRRLAEYAQRLPSSREGKTVNRTTLWRWATTGVRGVVLRTYPVGGGRFTSDADVAQFIAQLDGKRAPAPRPASAGDRNHLLDRFGLAEDELEEPSDE